MDLYNYKYSIASVLLRLNPVMISLGKQEILEAFRLQLDVANQESVSYLKEQIIVFLSDCLTSVQMDFVKLEEPDGTDVELFKKYLCELKSYKQNLTSSNSVIRSKITTLLKKSKSDLLNAITSQGHTLSTECLDTILSCPEAEHENGLSWVAEQIDQILNSFQKVILKQIKVSFDSVNDILCSEIKTLKPSCTQAIQLKSKKWDFIHGEVYSIAKHTQLTMEKEHLDKGVFTVLSNGFEKILAWLKVSNSADKIRRTIEIKASLENQILLAINSLKDYVLLKYNDFDSNLSFSIEAIVELVNSEIQDCCDALKSCELEDIKFDTKQKNLDNCMVTLERCINELHSL